MKLKELTKRIDDVLAVAGDPEAFHGDEDQLLWDWVQDRATPEELEQWKRLSENNIPRWYA